MSESSSSPSTSSTLESMTDTQTEESIASTSPYFKNPTTALGGTTWPTDSSNQKLYHGPLFPYPVVIIVLVWLVLALAYAFCRWREKPKSTYILPRVFVLCSPRTVQYHYELILRVGLPSYDFNPDKSDIDITILGQQKNEIVPITRLNTKTLLDEPLITNLSIVVYRLVELPQVGYLLLKHSGHFKSWIYAYDFTIIDLTTFKEQYYTLNHYIGSIEKIVQLDEPNNNGSFHYPIDDVPMPEWSLEDIFLFLYTLINSIMLMITLLPVNCDYGDDIFSVLIATMVGCSLVCFLDWLFYYYLKWNRARKEYFNDYEPTKICLNEYVIKIIVAIIATIIGFACIYLAININTWIESLVWSLAVVDSCTLVTGIWNLGREAEIGEKIIAMGLKLRGIETIPVGMRYSEIASNIQNTKSGSSTEENANSSISMTQSNLSRSVRPRSSAKSFGFDPITGHPSRKNLFLLSKFTKSRLSATGATPNNLPQNVKTTAVSRTSSLFTQPNQSSLQQHSKPVSTISLTSNPESSSRRASVSKTDSSQSKKHQK